jgi:Ala-tRNA(Pro) deacylase
MSLSDEQKRERIFSYLNELSITHETVNHEPAMTVEEELRYVQELLTNHNSCMAKNLFLKDKKGNLILLTAHCETKIDLKQFSKEIGAGSANLRFADSGLLEPTLGILPGAVTPLAMLNDTEKKVKMYFDSKIFEFEKVIIHPLTNNASTIITTENLKKFMQSTGHTFEIVKLVEI